MHEKWSKCLTDRKLARRRIVGEIISKINEKLEDGANPERVQLSESYISE
jgi:hypothetical protein